MYYSFLIVSKWLFKKFRPVFANKELNLTDFANEVDAGTHGAYKKNLGNILA